MKRRWWWVAALALVGVIVVGVTLRLPAPWDTIDSAFAEQLSLAGRLHTFTTIFLGIFIEAAPFLLLGALASGLVEVFVRPDALERLAPRRILPAALFGGLLGIALPVCECGIVVVVRRLLHKGLPLPVAIAFLLAAPVINPIVFASTYAAFGPGRMLLARFVLSFAIAVLIALVFGAARPREVLATHADGEHDHDHDHDQILTRAPTATASAPAAGRNRGNAGLAARLRTAVGAAGDDLFDVGRYLVAGSVLAAALQTVVPQQAILQIGGNPVSSVLALSALAFVISVCSTVDAFVALSFVGSFTPASILAFLVFGPMVDIKSALMFGSVFRPRIVLYLILLPLGCTVVACLVLATQVGF